MLSFAAAAATVRAIFLNVLSVASLGDYATTAAMAVLTASKYRPNIRLR